MRNYPRTHLKAAAFLVVSLILIMALAPSELQEAKTKVPVSLALPLGDTNLTVATDPVIVDPLAFNPNAPQATTTQTQTSFTVRRGDNLSKLFDRAGFTPQELYLVMSLGEDVSHLSKIQPGQTVTFTRDKTGQFSGLQYKAKAERTLHVERKEGYFVAQWRHVEPEVLISFRQAEITSEAPSLFHAGMEAGLSDNIVMQLSYIFQWDISFALDLRQGDQFKLLFEEKYLDGKKTGDGRIVAAEFINMKKHYQAVLYTDSKGDTNYYAPDGRSLRKAFIRDPVHFSHVSSGFNPKRLHPIHKRVMPHRGIDYAAMTGTPVLAAGDGKVAIARQNNASGKYIVIQHGEQYTTKYLHLSAFARGIHGGALVKQGQTIGYVGSTGWSTGPHLHYEFLVGGVHRNPRTVKLPQAEPVQRSELARFKRKTSPVLAQLTSMAGNLQLAAGDRAR